MYPVLAERSLYYLPLIIFYCPGFLSKNVGVKIPGIQNCNFYVDRLRTFGLNNGRLEKTARPRSSRLVLFTKY